MSVESEVMQVLAQNASTLSSSKANLELLLRAAEELTQTYKGHVYHHQLGLEVMRRAIREPDEVEGIVKMAAEVELACRKAWATGFPSADTLMPFIDGERLVSTLERFDKSEEEWQQEAQKYLSNPSEFDPSALFLMKEKSVAALEEVVQLFRDFRTRVMLALEFQEIVARADNKADSNSNSDVSVPKNALVTQLAVLINRQEGRKSTKLEVALELTEGNMKAAKNLLRQLRRFENLLK